MPRKRGRPPKAKRQQEKTGKKSSKNTSTAEAETQIAAKSPLQIFGPNEAQHPRAKRVSNREPARSRKITVKDVNEDNTPEKVGQNSQKERTTIQKSSDFGMVMAGVLKEASSPDRPAIFRIEEVHKNVRFYTRTNFPFQALSLLSASLTSWKMKIQEACQALDQFFCSQTSSLLWKVLKTMYPDGSSWICEKMHCNDNSTPSVLKDHIHER